MVYVRVITFFSTYRPRGSRNQRGAGKEERNRDKEAQPPGRNEVHPSRLTDVSFDTEMEDEESNRTDRFKSERCEKTSGFVKSSVGARMGESQGRLRDGVRWGRGGREAMGRGRGGREAMGRGRGVTRTWREQGREAGGMEEARVRGEVGESGRGEMEEKGDEMESQEKRLLDSLTDPRDVPKGTWYFEVSRLFTIHYTVYIPIMTEFEVDCGPTLCILVLLCSTMTAVVVQHSRLAHSDDTALEMIDTGLWVVYVILIIVFIHWVCMQLYYTEE